MNHSRDELDAMTRRIIAAAMKVHSRLGPGMLEKAYEACLVFELAQRGFHVRTQVAIPLVYEEVRVDTGFRADMVVNDSIVVELKAVEKLVRVHEVQLVSHLRAGRFRVGLLINFHEPHLRDGIRRRVNAF